MASDAPARSQRPLHTIRFRKGLPAEHYRIAGVEDERLGCSFFLGHTPSSPDSSHHGKARAIAVGTAGGKYPADPRRRTCDTTPLQGKPDLPAGLARVAPGLDHRASDGVMKPGIPTFIPGFACRAWREAIAGGRCRTRPTPSHLLGHVHEGLEEGSHHRHHRQYACASAAQGGTNPPAQESGGHAVCQGESKYTSGTASSPNGEGGLGPTPEHSDMLIHFIPCYTIVQAHTCKYHRRKCVQGGHGRGSIPRPIGVRDTKMKYFLAELLMYTINHGQTKKTNQAVAQGRNSGGGGKGGRGQGRLFCIAIHAPLPQETAACGTAMPDDLIQSTGRATAAAQPPADAPCPPWALVLARSHTLERRPTPLLSSPSDPSARTHTTGQRCQAFTKPPPDGCQREGPHRRRRSRTASRCCRGRTRPFAYPRTPGLPSTCPQDDTRRHGTRLLVRSLLPQLVAKAQASIPPSSQCHTLAAGRGRSDPRYRSVVASRDLGPPASRPASNDLRTDRRPATTRHPWSRRPRRRDPRRGSRAGDTCGHCPRPSPPGTRPSGHHNTALGSGAEAQPLYPLPGSVPTLTPT